MFCFTGLFFILSLSSFFILAAVVVGVGDVSFIMFFCTSSAILVTDLKIFFIPKCIIFKPLQNVCLFQRVDGLDNISIYTLIFFRGI